MIKATKRCAILHDDLLERAQFVRWLPLNKIEAQRSGFDFERKSNEAMRSFRGRPKVGRGNGESAVCFDELAQLVEHLKAPSELSQIMRQALPQAESA